MAEKKKTTDRSAAIKLGKAQRRIDALEKENEHLRGQLSRTRHANETLVRDFALEVIEKISSTTR